MPAAPVFHLVHLFVISAKVWIQYFRDLQVSGFPLSREWQLIRVPKEINFCWL